MSILWRGLVAIVMLALAVGGAAGTAMAKPRVPGDLPIPLAPTGPALPQSGAYWGSYVDLGDHYGSNRMLAMQAFEDQVGRKDVLDREYYTWDGVWPSVWDYWARDQAHLLMISWGARRSDGSSAKWADISAGDYDGDIDRRAEAIKAFGAPLFFIFNHEPEPKKGQPDPPGDPSDFVAAWQHIHDRFVLDGVTNVSYVLTLLSSDVNVGVAEDYYPGDAYVDILAADGYNWYGCPGRTEKASSFTAVFDDFYAWTLDKGKPMFIAETGTEEDDADQGAKADWISAMAAQMKAWPNIKGVAYYNNGPPGPDCTWYVDSSSSALAAYVAMGGDPYFNPSYTKPTAGGFTYIGAVDDSFSIPAGEMRQGVEIQFVVGGPSSHSVVDSSGMGYFDSGTKSANTFYALTLPGAGNYTYKCNTHSGMTQTLKVPLIVSPGSGDMGTPFGVTWASTTAPDGYTYNVQVQRPGDSAWSGWMMTQTGKGATFAPDAGPGTYDFRAQLKNSSNGKGSGYSVVVSIDVSGGGQPQHEAQSDGAASGKAQGTPTGNPQGTSLGAYPANTAGATAPLGRLRR